MKKYKAVVIGCGKIGAQEWLYPQNVKPVTHAAAYFLHPHIELVGLFDIDPGKLKKAKKFFLGVPLYHSAEKMLKETQPDIVSIATHPNTHDTFVAMAANYGAKAILCEKPMADSLKKAERMVAMCARKKCLLFINHSRHFDSLINAWQGKIKRGALGEILQAHCLYHNGAFNNGTHAIDLLRMFLGEAQKVSGFYNAVTSNPKRDKNIDAMIFFKNGARAIMQSVSEGMGMTEWVFYGTRGSLALKHLGMEAHYNNAKEGAPRSLIAQTVLHIIACLGKKEKPKSTGTDALEISKVLFALKKSAQRNGKVIPINSK